MMINELNRPVSWPLQSEQKAYSRSLLGGNICEVRASNTSLFHTAREGETAHFASKSAGIEARSGLASFNALHNKQAIQDLFSVVPAGQQPKLVEIFQQSHNTYAHREITEFAKVYSQLIRQPDLSVEARTMLDALAQQYTDKIQSDGLGEKSAFGPWTASKGKQYQQRSQIEHKLAEFANQHFCDSFLQLGSGFMSREVMPFIQNCIEQRLGAPLTAATNRNLMDVVDKAAMQAFNALREGRTGLIDQHGLGVGKLARDLDTVATLPLLLRNVLAQLPQDLLQTVPPSTSAPASGPDGSTPAAPAAVAAGPGGVTINIGDIHIDNSKYTDKSKRTNNRQPQTSQSRSAPTPMAQNLTLQVNQKVSDAAMAETTPKMGSQGKMHAANPVLNASVQRHQLVKTQVAASESVNFHRVTASVAEKLIPASSSNSLHDAASMVANSLSELVDVALNGDRAQYTGHKSAAEYVSLQEHRVTQTHSSSIEALSIPVSAMAMPLTSASAKNGLLDAGRDVAKSLSDLLDVAVGGNPTSDAESLNSKLDAGVGEEMNRAGGYASLQFREGNLYTLPSQAALRGSALKLKPEQELLRTVRSMLELDANQPWETRREFEHFRRRLLPAFESDRTQVWNKLAAPQSDDGLLRDVATLKHLLAEHPKLERQRQNIANVARTLMRESGLVPSGQPIHPLVMAVLDGVAGVDEAKWDWREEANRNQPLTSSLGIILTNDALHADVLRR
ncbi:hypothetical protein [Obesumbacterium proteus]|uniref:hypothetical protein n=1 Tax=Obesumbacterium proteus TaxID=82983 RepID=UPI00242D376B|nr:hypothetical protein [Obesumbacterium proteus]